MNRSVVLLDRLDQSRLIERRHCLVVTIIALDACGKPP